MTLRQQEYVFPVYSDAVTKTIGNNQQRTVSRKVFRALQRVYTRP
jgi:hypothetical protein